MLQLMLRTKLTGDSDNAQNRRSLGDSSKGKSVVMPAEKVNEKIDPETVLSLRKPSSVSLSNEL